MSLDAYFICEPANPANSDAGDFEEVLENQVKSLSMEEKIDSTYKMMRAEVKRQPRC